MKKSPNKILLATVIVLAVALLTALYFVLRPSPQALAPDLEEMGGTTASTEEKNLAPDFIVYDADGNAVRLSDYIGKPVVLNFWASWCPPCRGEMPDFQEKYLELGDEVQFLMINLTDGSQETVGSARDFITSQGYTFPVFYDTSSNASKAYSIRSIPATYFIDAEGCLVAQATGAIDAETLQKGIDMITG